MLFSPADGIGTWTITELISPALFYGSLGVSFLVRFSRRLPIVVTTQPPPPTPPTPPLLRLLFLLTGPLHLSHLGVGLKAAGILKSTFLQPPFHSSLSLSLSLSQFLAFSGTFVLCLLILLSLSLSLFILHSWLFTIWIRGAIGMTSSERRLKSACSGHRVHRAQMPSLIVCSYWFTGE